MRKRNAFIDQYRKEPGFEDGLDEFDDARFVHDIQFWLSQTVSIRVIPSNNHLWDLEQSLKSNETDEISSLERIER